MRYSNRWAAMAALAALATGNAAQAADVVYLGDCTRAQAVKQQSTINTLLPHKRYEGITRIHAEGMVNSQCNRDQLQIYTLTEKSRSTSEVIFDVSRSAIDFGKIRDCMVPKDVGTVVTGTVRFTTELAAKGDLCELYIWSNWTLRYSGDANWKGDFSNRALGMEGGSFVISQPSSDGVKYWTPAAFTGVNK